MKLTMGILVAAALLAPAGELKLGEPVPDITLKSLDGKECSLKGLTDAGKVIAIVSWSVDCPSGKPCIGRNNDVAKKFAGNEKVAFIGVSSYGDAAEKLAAYHKENSLTYPLVHDGDRAIAKHFNAKQVNSAYVIAGGKLFWRGGVTKDGKDGFADAIQAALDGKPAPESDKKFPG
jgi:peroxiredoxin